MTKKHFKAIAEAIRHNRTLYGSDTEMARVVDRLSAELADVISDLAPRFDRSKFLAACGHGNYQTPLFKEGDQ